MKLTVDARMCAMSGIGRYIRGVLPYVCDAFDTTLLVTAGANMSFLCGHKFSAIRIRSGIYTLTEQAELPLRVPLCDVFWSPHYNVPLFNIKARRRAVTIHDVYHLAYFGTLTVPQKIYAKALMSAAVRKSDVIFTNSDFSKADIQRLSGANAKKVLTVYPGTDREIFNENCNDAVMDIIRSKYNLPDSFILFVGNIKPHKNIELLLKALKADETLNLVAVGKMDGFITGDRRVFDILAKDSKLSSRVIFTGYVPDDEMTVMYNMADVFVFPSIYEGFGLPVLEAQSCGCPVAASDSAGIPEAGGDGALYFASGDTQSILNTINTLRHNKEIKKSIIAKGRDNVKNFGWDKTAESVISVLRSLV